MAIVSLDRLCKKYPGGEALAVDSVSLEIAHGEFMVLLGPSGCGKSTTLRMVAGLEAISSGELSIDGKRVNDIPAKDRDIAMVFQSYALYPHMSVFDNLAFGLRRRNFSSSEIERRVRDVSATLGLAEDTWGLNAKILDDDGFLHQCIEADSERERMFFDALSKVRRGLCVCVFDGTDRIQHMFWRYIDPKHPAHEGQTEPNRQRRDAIEQLYCRMDELVGRTMEECQDRDTVLMVISDHGFNPFRRGIDLNVWLEQNGYLKLKPDGRGKKYLTGVDWSQTKAYCLGLAGLWLNIKGREAKGIVDPKEANALRDEICTKLTGLRDEECNDEAIHRAFNAHRIYDGPYKADAPDIIIGYNRGYRVSWEAAIGQSTDALFHDNTKAWSGDHCIDPKLVPGVLFCNRKITAENPRLMDIGPTALEMFGVPTATYMDGKPLAVGDA